MKRWFYILFIIGAILSSQALADETNFSASVDKKAVALDDTVAYTVGISGSGANSALQPNLSAFDNLQMIGSFQSSNISIINGQTSVQKSFTYTLRPKNVGPASIGAASITINGKTLQSDPIQISVTKAEGKPQKLQARQANPFGNMFDGFFNDPLPKFNRSQNIEDPIKITNTVNRTTAYVNQLVLMTFTFYRRVNLYSQPGLGLPKTTGFWSINLSDSNDQPKQVTLDGKQYLAQEFKTALFPTLPGTFTLDSATLTYQLDPFTNPQTLKTKPITITILPLPESGKPASFSGSVGSYQITAGAKTREVEQGQPIALLVKVSGQGNIKTISEPQANLGQDFKKLLATSTEQISHNQFGVFGNKTFEIVLIPLISGQETIPGFRFSYFDPNKKEYRTIISQPIEFTVTPAKHPLPKEYTADINQADNLVKITIPWRRIAKKILTILFSIYTLVIIFIGLWVWGVKTYRQKLLSDPIKLRTSRAKKVAAKRLKKSYRLIKESKLKKFIGEIFASVTSYLGDKYNFSSLGVTADQLKEILSHKGISSQAQTKLDNFISECDLLRFTPASLTADKARELANIAEELIVLIEKG